MFESLSQAPVHLAISDDARRDDDRRSRVLRGDLIELLGELRATDRISDLVESIDEEKRFSVDEKLLQQSRKLVLNFTSRRNVEAMNGALQELIEGSGSKLCRVELAAPDQHGPQLDLRKCFVIG